MKLLIVGSWTYPMYEQAIADACRELGHEVQAFGWEKYFKSLLGRAEAKFSVAGPNIRRLNRDLLRQAGTYRPDLVLTWRATGLLPSTLRRLKQSGVRYLVSYNHDDFTGPSVGAPVPWHHRVHWRLFLRGARYYDHHFVKRDSNIDHLRTLGSPNNHIGPMWFVPAIHRPVQLDAVERQRFGCDVVFVGHYEPDERVEQLRALVRAGFKVRLFGGAYWGPATLGELYDYFAPIAQAQGEDYSKALCGAQICLCFLSKLNRDTYTRRCFEIPACGRVMLAERTSDLQKLFKEDEEACFFSSQQELVEKVTWLMANPQIRERIAAAGLRRVWADGHDAGTWSRRFLSIVAEANA